MDVAKLLEDVALWAAGETAVVGVALVGSHARGAARPDSDVDLMVLAGEPELHLENPAWLERFGRVTSYEVEDWGRVTSLRAFYAGGLEVEFGLSTPAWAEFPVDAGTRRVVGDGMRVLYDPEGVLEMLDKAVSASA